MTNEQIEYYSSYIYGIAKYFDGYKNKEDLYQAGCVGLIEAYQKYKNDGTTKFTTYAYPYILGEMCKLVREDKAIKISRNITRLKKSIDQTISILSQKLLRMPTNKEISEFLEVPLEEIEKALKTVNIIQSIDEAICEDGKELNLYDITPSKQMDIDSLLELKEILNNMDDKNKKILLYSLEMNQTEIGQIFDMNQVQVSRRLTKIKNDIRNKVNSR
jgi:RNA polymerase sigma factor (sigma-70 family)